MGALVLGEFVGFKVAGLCVVGVRDGEIVAGLSVSGFRVAGDSV